MMRRYLAEHLPQIWQDKTHPVSTLLYPVSILYGLVIRLRRRLYELDLIKSKKVNATVIIVGNITVGGTGKTPFVIWLADYLHNKGLKVGIISRGYGGSSPVWPVDVSDMDRPETVGDEAVMLRRKTGLPVVVSPIRYEAAQMLIQRHNVDVIISDDGLQHLALNRDLEIIIVDARQQFGNNRLLPSGPLREPVSAISTHAIQAFSGNQNLDQYEYSIKFQPIQLRNIRTPEKTAGIDELDDRWVNAVAGIGQPDKFFDMLESLDFKVSRHAFPDHHEYQAEDLEFDNQQPIIMTEKDAVKCTHLVNYDAWYLEITVSPNIKLKTRLDEFLTTVR